MNAHIVVRYKSKKCGKDAPMETVEISIDELLSNYDFGPPCGVDILSWVIVPDEEEKSEKVG